MCGFTACMHILHKGLVKTEHTLGGRAGGQCRAGQAGLETLLLDSAPKEGTLISTSP
jgi:hypothetical protein